MVRRCLKGSVLALALVAGLFLGQQAACVVLPAWLENARPDSSTPTIELPYRQRDLGAVPQGSVLRTSFPLTNTGTRRLILVEQSRGCCGQSAGQRETTVRPGEATALSVQVDTSRWCGRMREVVRYSTNDPDMPRFALSVTADVIPATQPAEEADPDGRGLISALP
jgi:hypothetical protein